MTWILYAHFASTEQAETALANVLDLGVAPEDVSLVALAGERSVNEARLEIESRRTHAEELRYGFVRAESEGRDEFESAVGGGISTSEPEDAVSGVEEMDDGPDVAEDLTEPVRQEYFGTEDLEDVDRLAERGTIDSTRPTGEGFDSVTLPYSASSEDDGLSVEIRGGLMIVGDGALATQLLVMELNGHPEDPSDAVKQSLYKLGVAPPEAIAMGGQIEVGGAVLAVSETLSTVPLEQIEATVAAAGGASLQTFVQAGTEA